MARMKKVKINFMDMGQTPNEATDWFVNMLSRRYEVEVSQEPDVIFYSIAGGEHHKFDGLRIFWTGENVAPNFNVCDYALGFQHITLEDRYFRLPLWRLYTKELDKVFQPKQVANPFNRPFCACVISNIKRTDGRREQLFDTINAYKPIASGGRFRNTTGERVKDKLLFQQQYKFSLAFENCATSGYTTEKILQSFASATIPIYYGDPRVNTDFNPEAFVNVADFDTPELLQNYLKKLDTDPEAYQKIYSAPTFKDGHLPQALSDEAILDFLAHIFDQPLSQARRRCFYKAYNDIDFSSLKKRDVFQAVKGWLFRR